MSEFGALGLVFSHISIIRTRNHVPIFLWTPYSLRNILSKFQIFCQSARLVGNQFVGPACIEHWFWCFWTLLRYSPRPFSGAHPNSTLFWYSPRYNLFSGTRSDTILSVLDSPVLSLIRSLFRHSARIFDLFQHRVRFSLVFSGIVSRFL